MIKKNDNYNINKQQSSMLEKSQDNKHGINKSSPNKFLRIRHSQNIECLKPQKILTTLRNNQFLFVDFGDEKAVKVLEPGDPNQSDQQAHTIGNNYIADWKNLSPHSYNMLQYLSDNRALQQHKKNIDEIVRARVQRIEQRKRMKQMQASKNKRKNLKNYSMDQGTQQNQKQKKQSKALINSLRFNQNSHKIEQFLQKAHNQIMTQKLKEGERQLHKSLSSAGNYKKLIRSFSIQFQNAQKKKIGLSNFDSYGTSRKKNDNDVELSLLKLPEIRKIRYEIQKA